MNQGHIIPVLHKATHLLMRLADNPKYESVGALAREMGMATATCYRILKTLEAADWLQCTAQGCAHVSLGLLPVAQALAQERKLLELVREPMQTLAQQTRLAVKLSVRQGDQHVTMYRVESPQAMAATGRVGSRFAIVIGATGAALLSRESSQNLAQLMNRIPQAQWEHQTPAALKKQIADCKKTGCCRNLTRHPRGIDVMSAPVCDVQDNIIAAITLIGLQGELDGAARVNCQKHLLNAVKQCHQQFVAVDARQTRLDSAAKITGKRTRTTT